MLLNAGERGIQKPPPYYAGFRRTTFVQLMSQLSTPITKQLRNNITKFSSFIKIHYS
jgi:hypothetical protein